MFCLLIQGTAMTYRVNIFLCNFLSSPATPKVRKVEKSKSCFWVEAFRNPEGKTFRGIISCS